MHAAERDPTVLAYWDQPGKIRLTSRSADDRRVVVGHTPDYVELREETAGWVECKPEDKPEERLLHLAQAVPHRYQRGPGGRWMCPPGQAYAAQFGLTYRLFSSAEITWVEQRNWAFLADYFRRDCPTVAPDALAIVRAVVESAPGLTLIHLQQRVQPVATVDDINILIATARIYVDLRTHPPAEPEYVPVFPDLEMAQASAVVSTLPAALGLGSPPLVEVAPGTPVLRDGRPGTIGNPTETHTPLVSSQRVAPRVRGP